MAITWKELLAKPVESVPFLVDPLVPRGGVVLFYGKTSIGKTPFTWELVRCLATGDQFFGHLVTPCRVLYIEVDTPELLVQTRMLEAGLVATDNVWFEFAGPFNILKPIDPVTARLAAVSREIQPEAVIVNTLRKVYAGEDISSETPKSVYGAFMRMFPGAALVFAHHERKSRSGAEDAFVDQREDFAGSAAWLNDAQVGLQLIRNPKRPEKPEPGALYLRLDHVKSQVSELEDPLHLILREGAHWTVSSDEERARIVALWTSLDGTNDAKARQIGTELGMSRASVYRKASAYGLVSKAVRHVRQSDV